MMLNRLRTMDQQTRLVAGRFRFLPWRINGAVQRAMDMKDKTGRTTAIGYRLVGSMIAEDS